MTREPGPTPHLGDGLRTCGVGLVPPSQVWQLGLLIPTLVSPTTGSRFYPLPHGLAVPSQGTDTGCGMGQGCQRRTGRGARVPAL